MKHKGLTGQRNQCAGCGEIFNSNFAFDKHRIGTFGVDRRCATVEEMLEMGMDKNSSKYWVSSLYTDSQFYTNREGILGDNDGVDDPPIQLGINKG